MNEIAVDFALGGKDESALLYYDGLNLINRNEMKTLGDDVEVTNCVIDGWARFLNHKKPRNKIYFSTVLHHIMCTNRVCREGSSMKTRINAFIERIDNELKLNKIDSIVGYKQVFFPVSTSQHFFLLCVNHIEDKIHIIDNRKLPKKVSVQAKYEEQPKMMLKGLAEYMKHLGYQDAKRIEDYTVVLEKMKWRSNNDYTNCGVYMMKHMETFTADPNESWICDLKPNNVEQIRKLRLQYTANRRKTLMLFEENTESRANRRKARKFATL
ncbi:uncharacterized protein LOC110710262 [Chenopodium quinoa]|uniref:uncharacterized protein LOC110710262 n=1 Tax=Chenopodium quinoa TaxID=63459 RepID=UPI000B77B911|nr:uncharacterized protein LOC110710262 [Chenopodium quinoa]